MSDPVAEVAKLVTHVSDLEAQLWAKREDCAAARRHRGQLAGFLLGLLADDRLSAEVAEETRCLLAQQESEGSPHPSVTTRIRVGASA